jgi:hypothetical protein
VKPLAMLIALFLLTTCSTPPRITLEALPIYIYEERVTYEYAENLSAPLVSMQRDGDPVIQWDERFSALEPEVQLYVLGHEYCHLALPGQEEMYVECCSVAWVHALGISSPQTWTKILDAMQSYPASSPHYVGDSRQKSVWMCIEIVTNGRTPEPDRRARYATYPD